ncbi:RNA polymerase sigma factor [Nannocystaceae bacterium ST9]
MASPPRKPTLDEVAATVRASYPMLRRFFAKKVSPAEVQDLTQATILTFLEKDLAGVEHPRRFLFGIARNKLLQHFDKQRGGVGFDSQQISARQHSTTLGTKLDRSTRIIEALRELPLDWQMAVELRYGEELELSEVAEAMDKSLAQIKRYLRSGLDQARAQLGATLDDDALSSKLGVAYREG